MYTEITYISDTQQHAAFKIQWCVFAAKTEKVFDETTCEYVRVKRDAPRFFGVPVLTFGTFYNLGEVNLLDVNDPHPWVYGYTPWALRRGEKARKYFPVSVHDTEAEMEAAIWKEVSK